MTHLARWLSVPVLAVLVLTGCSADPATRSAATTSTALPDVTLAAFGGGPSLDLATLKGPAVLNVWASWCGPCRKELPHYQAFSQKYAGKVRVLGVDFQDTRADQAQQLVRQTGVRFPLFADPEGKFRARALPELVLVDASGKVAYRRYVQIESLAQLEQLVAKHLGVTL